MNSSQRRKLKREFPHVIEMFTKVGEHYIVHDDRVIDAHKWCKRKSIDVRLDASWDHAKFKFAQQKDAVYFALKWL